LSRFLVFVLHREVPGRAAFMMATRNDNGRVLSGRDAPAAGALWLRQPVAQSGRRIISPHICRRIYICGSVHTPGRTALSSHFLSSW
jgi:hypothetical protein